MDSRLKAPTLDRLRYGCIAVTLISARLIAAIYHVARFYPGRFRAERELFQPPDPHRQSGRRLHLFPSLFSHPFSDRFPRDRSRA